ncbi:MAG: response regulator, partial [Patescibacteria group bacterium]
GELGLALAIKEEPELILLDMMMPKMDGMTMLTALRLTGAWGNTVPVLLLTNLGSDDKLAMKEITEDPHAQYLVKSNWPLGKLVEKVRETVTLQGVYNY